MAAGVHDAIVVGSGAGGLSAAVCLSNMGYSVLVAEAQPNFGGYLNPFRRRGYTFDTGLHYIGGCGPGGRFDQFFERNGLKSLLKFNEICPDGFIRHVFPSFEFSIPKGHQAFLERLLETFPNERRAIAKFGRVLDDLRGAIDALSPADGSRKMSYLRALRHLPGFLASMSRSVGGFANSITRDVGLRSVISAYSGEVGAAPELAALFTAYAFVHYEDGAFYPAGGSGAFRDAFVRRIRANGGELVARSPVTSVQKSGSCWKVVAGDEEYHARTLVWGAAPENLYFQALQDTKLPEKTVRRWKRAIPSYGAFYLFAGTQVHPDTVGLGPSTIIHWADDDVGESYKRIRNLCMDSFILSCTSAKDPGGGHAPRGYHAVEAVLFLPWDAFRSWAGQSAGRRSGEYNRLKRELGDILLANIERAIPAYAGGLEVIDYATPVTNHYWTWAPAGGCYGHMQCVGQMGLDRFTSRTPLPGIYLCGSSTNMAGVYPAAISGERAAHLAHGFLRKKRGAGFICGHRCETPGRKAPSGQEPRRIREAGRGMSPIRETRIS